MLMNPNGLLPMFCVSATEKVLEYTLPQFCCLLFIFGVLLFLFSSND